MQRGGDTTDYIRRFLQDEIVTEELYNDIMFYITSCHIRTGEFEGNVHIIEKIDLENFLLYAEYSSSDGIISIKKDELIKAINNYATLKGIKVKNKT